MILHLKHILLGAVRSSLKFAILFETVLGSGLLFYCFFYRDVTVRKLGQEFLRHIGLSNEEADSGLELIVI